LFFFEAKKIKKSKTKQNKTKQNKTTKNTKGISINRGLKNKIYKKILKKECKYHPSKISRKF
jgi:hypothetical protein